MFNFAVFHTSSIEQMPYAVVEDALFVSDHQIIFPKLGVAASGLLKDPIICLKEWKIRIYPKGQLGTPPFWKAYQMQP